MTKKELRMDIINKRKALSENIKLNAPKVILETLKSMAEYKSAKIISSFVSFRDELEMKAINENILLENKILLLPYIDPKAKEMVFYAVDDLSMLVRNDYGILEPNPAIHNRFDHRLIECILTPGVAFDQKGYRLGYGGGFYDKFFSEIKKTTPKIGVAYEMQFVDVLPVEHYDQSITHLVTEKGIRCFL